MEKKREKIKSIFPHAQTEKLIYPITVPITGLIGHFKQLAET